MCYVFVEERVRPEYLDVWDIMGLRQRPDASFLFEFRFMHFDIEELERSKDAFDPLQVASSTLRLKSFCSILGPPD